MRLYRYKNTYYVDIHVGGIRFRHSLRTHKIDVAYQRATEFEQNLSRTSTYTLSAYASDYLSRRATMGATAPSTLHRDNDFFQFVLETDAARPLSSITNVDAERWVASYLSRHAPSTTNMFIRHLKAAFQAALQRDLLPDNPFAKVRQITVPKRYPRALTDAQVADLLSAARAHPDRRLYQLIILGAYAGLRRNESTNLRWEAFDWESRNLHVESFGHVKTKNRDVRSIPLHRLLIAEFEPLRQPTGFVFTSHGAGKNGYHFDPRRSLTKLFAAANLPHVTYHWLRHTFGTRLARAGVPIQVIRSLMGHSSITVTEMYAHAAPTQTDIDLLS